MKGLREEGKESDYREKKTEEEGKEKGRKGGKEGRVE